MREVQGPLGVVRPPMHTDAAWYRTLADPESGMHPPYGSHRFILVILFRHAEQLNQW